MRDLDSILVKQNNEKSIEKLCRILDKNKQNPVKQAANSLPNQSIVVNTGGGKGKARILNHLNHDVTCAMTESESGQLIKPETAINLSTPSAADM